MLFYLVFFFFKQKTAYEMRISDWSSDVCSSDLGHDTGYEVQRSIAFFIVQHSGFRNNAVRQYGNRSKALLVIGDDGGQVLGNCFGGIRVRPIGADLYTCFSLA